MKQFKLVRPGTDDDVLGGAVSRGNVYLTAYGRRLAGEKAIDDLAIGEGSLHRYSLSGSKPTTYKIVRVDDAEQE